MRSACQQNARGPGLFRRTGEPSSAGGGAHHAGSKPLGERPASARGAWHFLRRAAVVVLGLISIFPLLPYSPVFPSDGLDPSWIFALNYAVAHHFRFGSQIVSTFGPYAMLYTHGYAPGTSSLMFVGCFYIAATWLFAWWCIFRGRVSGGAVTKLALYSALVFALQETIGSRVLDALFMIYPIVATIAVTHLIDDNTPDGAASPTRSETLSMLAVCAPLGLIAIIKVSFAIPCAFASVGILSILIRSRHYGSAAVCAAATIATGLVGWVAAGQPLEALLPFIARAIWVVSGYTAAMSVAGRATDWLYIMFEVLCVWTLLVVAAKRRTNSIVSTLTILVVMFMLFKEGIVRHDAHVLATFGGLALVAVLASFMSERPRLVLPLALAAAACGMSACAQYTTVSWSALRNGVLRDVAAAGQTVSHAMNADHGLADSYEAALAAIRAKARMPVLPGSSDVYPVDVAQLVASGNTWSPRPVFQSYFAYGPRLAAQNAAHLAGPHAPRNVFFAIAPIDNRLPALEDGASWPALLTRYAPRRISGHYAVLERRSKAPPMRLGTAGGGTGQLGEPVKLAAQSGVPVFATFDVRPSPLGRALSLAFKPPELEVTLWLSGGGAARYRFIAGMAKSPFLLSPQVFSAEQFVLLYGPPGLSGDRTVRAFRIDVVGDGPRSAWRPAYTYRLFSLHDMTIQSSSRIAELAGIEIFVPLEGNHQVESVSHQCSLDAINDQPAAAVKPVSLSSTATFGGWMGDGHGHAIGHGVLILRGNAGSYAAPFSTTISRPDVATALHSDGMTLSGYQLTAALGHVVPGHYAVLVAGSASPATLCNTGATLDVR